MSLHLFEIDDGERWWYVAESEDEALKMYLEPMINYFPHDLTTVDEKLVGCPLSNINVSKVPDDKSLKIHMEDDKEIVTKTALEWAADGKGFVAGTVW